MKPQFYIFIICFFVGACAKKKEPISVVQNPVVYEGGAGGTFGIVVFTKFNNKGTTSRAFLKYAAAKAPSDTTLYDEKTYTMTEPGYGPHAHFNHLKKGTYYIFASGNNNNTTISADTVLWLTDSSAAYQELYLNLK